MAISLACQGYANPEGVMHVMPLTWGELYRFTYPLSTPDTCRLYTWVTWALFLGWQPPDSTAARGMVAEVERGGH